MHSALHDTGNQLNERNAKHSASKWNTNHYASDVSGVFLLEIFNNFSSLDLSLLVSCKLPSVYGIIK